MIRTLPLVHYAKPIGIGEEEIRDLMPVARVVADPTDLLSTVTALRSPVFGCGDDDLWAWKQERGSFNLLARPAESQPAGVVRDGLDYAACMTDRDG